MIISGLSMQIIGSYLKVSFVHSAGLTVVNLK